MHMSSIYVQMGIYIYFLSWSFFNCIIFWFKNKATEQANSNTIKSRFSVSADIVFIFIIQLKYYHRPCQDTLDSADTLAYSSIQDIFDTSLLNGIQNSQCYPFLFKEKKTGCAINDPIVI